jgi:hypothetical protein
MARSPTGSCTLALAVAVGFAATCATKAETFEPRHAGDRCFEVCPEGLVCTAPVDAGAPNTTDPRHCELAPDRCTADLDCHNQQPHCVGASRSDIGFCAYGLPF